jgi:hypothetical protein
VVLLLPQVGEVRGETGIVTSTAVGFAEELDGLPPSMPPRG